MIHQKDGEQVGKTISHYNIFEILGEGGMGVVYKAFDTKLEREVALKVLRPEAIGDPAAKERFIREARAASALNHPNITTIYEIDEWHGQDFICMEYVEGETVKKKIQSDKMSMDEVLSITVQVAEALQEAHEHDIIHRDIKSENIMVTSKGQVKVMDFGLAKLKGMDGLTKAGTTMGTISYMSPEQARGEDVDHQSDIWSFGVVLYEMLTGQLPFKGDHEVAIIYSILNEEPTPVNTIQVDVPKIFVQIMPKLLAKDSGKRYHHIVDLMADLQRIQDSQTTKPPRRLLAKRKPSLSRILISPLLWIMIIAVFVLTMGIFVFYPTSAIPFYERGWILITDFENLTGDDIFDRSLNTAFAIGIGQSSYINILPQKRITETLHRMKKDSIAHIDETIGREISMREGINVIVVPSIAVIEDTYSLMGEIQDANTGSTYKSEIVRAHGKEEVLVALDELSKKIRKDLGESIIAISKQSKPLHEVTTASLEALKQYSLGKEHLINLNFEEARLYFENALQIDSNFTAAMASLGSLYFEKFDQAKGKALLSKAINKIDGLTNKEKYGILAFNACYVEKDLEKAIKYYKMRLALYPDDEAAHHNIGWCYQLMKRYQEAANAYKKVIQINPYAMMSYTGLSWIYLFYLGEVDSALAICKRQLAYNDQIPWTFHYLGWAYIGKDSLKQAQEAFERALELNPRFTWSLNGLAHTYRMQGRFQKAVEPLKKILKINPTETSVYYDLGIIYQHLGDSSTALQHLRKFRSEMEKEVQKKPNNGNSFILLGIILSQLGDKEQAMMMAQKGIQLDSTQYYAYARFLSVQGKKQEALDYLELAIKNGFTNYIGMKIHPSLQSLYNEPGFKDIINKRLKK